MKLSPNQAAASLGLATRLQDEHLIPNEQPQSPQTPQDAPETEQTQPNPIDEVKGSLKDLEAKMIGELDTIKDLIEKAKPKDQNRELEDLKKQITEVLKENDNETD